MILHFQYIIFANLCNCTLDFTVSGGYTECEVIYLMSWQTRIRQAREEQKLTREQVVNKMRTYMGHGKGIALRTLIAWERGESEPRVTQAIALARALGYNEVSTFFAKRTVPSLIR